MKRIDIHCHPSIKPYGQSFSFHPAGQNTTNVKQKNSIFHYDPPTAFDRLLNRTVMGLTKFTQTDVTTLHKGGFSVVVVSLSPLEKPFITNAAGNNLIADGVTNLVTGVGKARIDDVQASVYRYFNDLEKDYQFYCQLDGAEVTVAGQRLRYKLVRSFTAIDNAPVMSDVHTVFMLMSIEGGHAFNNRSYLTYNHDDVLNNIRIVKQWEYPPVFVTLAHHFKNHLTGHAQSLTGVVDWMTNQEADMNADLHEIGKEAIRLLLNPNEGARCLIDIKHMSEKARTTYFQMLKGEFSGEGIPVVVSHGAVNGLVSPQNKTVSTLPEAGAFYSGDINFYDSEIIDIARTGGIFGIQLDERRIAGKERLKKSNLWFASRSKRLLAKSELVWNQIVYIARLLDRAGLDAWTLQALGTDFDGVIDPVNMFWTAEDMPLLEQNLLIHAQRFVDKSIHEMSVPNQISAHDIVANFMGANAERFFRNAERGCLVDATVADRAQEALVM
ncbi:membrane dipeptidase (peptidase family M19) [Breznakibacter xylanolyticus]|uniref:Membrane dipeptidase (Peptidase family M19) n=1 Tax=Breznakibacter xylanolyticus TaxID=990 RepID=A0A2W7NF25_9BACT|nr:membrane dipeptidase [Breznakibacter xylanolyticus]MBN2743003.1 membrane dipeptidase [Marinilabiliaceae bacterium]PZX15324.1 membrane dipeptidase (peptidase family M19) [Breznakibacter xylanolyticus]